MSADRAKTESRDLTARLAEIRELERKVAEMKRELLAAAPGDEAAAGELTFLVTRCRGRLLATPIAHVEEVVQMPAIEPLPTGARAVAGLVDYHGETLAVIDLAELATGEPAPLGRDQSLVICRAGERRVALQVDEIADVVSVAADDIRVAEEVLPGALHAAGVFRVEGAIAFIADVGWMAVGAEVANLVAADAATPRGEDA